MEVDVITSLISNMGFPIACVVAMFYMWNKERVEHEQENKEWLQALNNNTSVMNAILDQIKELRK